MQEKLNIKAKNLLNDGKYDLVKSKWNFKTRKKNLSSEEEFSFKSDFGIVNVISLFIVRNTLWKQIMRTLKNSSKPHRNGDGSKRKLYHWNHPSRKHQLLEITASNLEQQWKSVFSHEPSDESSFFCFCFFFLLLAGCWNIIKS